jgi:hypothetical protein
MNTPHVPSDSRKMPTPSNSLPQGDHQTGESSRVAIADVIKKQVMQSLGWPNEMLGVQVRPVGGDHYRVNVLVGKDVTCARVANSYFLEIDGNGKILRSSPAITKVY